MNIARYTVLAASLICFSGCFELLEEVWINPDGSARLKVDIGMPEAMLLMGEQEEGENPFADLDQDFLKTKEVLEKHPGVTRVDFEQHSDGTLKRFVLVIDVSDYATLADLPAIIYTENEDTTVRMMPLEESELLVIKQGEGRVLFTRRFGQPTEGDSPDTSREGVGEALAETMFGNYYYTVRLHAPEITSSNGTIDSTKKVVEWKVPIGQLLAGKPFQREFRAEIVSSENMLVWIVAVVAMVVIAGGIIVMVRKKKTA